MMTPVCLFRKPVSRRKEKGGEGKGLRGGKVEEGGVDIAWPDL